MVEEPDQLEVLATGEQIVDCRELTRQTDDRSYRLRLVDDVKPCHSGTAAVRTEKCGEHAYERGLAGAVRSQEVPLPDRLRPRARSLRAPSSSPNRLETLSTSIISSLTCWPGLLVGIGGERLASSNDVSPSRHRPEAKVHSQQRSPVPAGGKGGRIVAVVHTGLLWHPRCSRSRCPATRCRGRAPIGHDRFEELERAVLVAREQLRGKTVWNINSTAAGGGVAEMLLVLVGYMLDARTSTSVGS